MRSNFEPLGKYIKKVNDRNDNSEIETLKGININKEFMPSVANTIGSNMARYRVVSQWQFAYNPMHVGRDEVLPISMLKDDSKVIVSPAYVVFEITNYNQLNPEYLMMWCRRSEFDRNAWFTTDNSVRGGFSWESLCEMELPIPPIEKQREIVAEYKAVVDRVELNEQINQKLEETAKAIYRQWFEEFEFPISKDYAESIGKPELEGKPYKSSGGEMVYNEELDGEIPLSWHVNELGDLASISAGGDKPKVYSEYKTDEFRVPIYSNTTKKEGLFGFTNEAKVFENSITISARGAIIGYTVLRRKPFVPIVRLIVVSPKNEYQLNYIFNCIDNFRYDDLSSAQGQLTIPEISSIKVLNPNSVVQKKFQNICQIITDYSDSIKLENKNLLKTKKLFTSKMSKSETELEVIKN